MEKGKRLVSEENGETYVAWDRYNEDGKIVQRNLEKINDGHYFYNIEQQKSGWAGDNRDKKGH